MRVSQQSCIFWAVFCDDSIKPNLIDVSLSATRKAAGKHMISQLTGLLLHPIDSPFVVITNCGFIGTVFFH